MFCNLKHENDLFNIMNNKKCSSSSEHYASRFSRENSLSKVCEN